MRVTSLYTIYVLISNKVNTSFTLATLITCGQKLVSLKKKYMNYTEIYTICNALIVRLFFKIMI